MKKVIDIGVYALVFMLFIMIYLQPLFGLILVLPLLVLLMYIYNKLGVYVVLAMWLCYTLLSIFTAYDLVSVIVSTVVLFGFLGLVWASHGKKLIKGFIISIAACTLGVILPIMSISIISDFKPQNCVENYIKNGQGDIIITLMAKVNYLKYEPIDNKEKLTPKDEGYNEEILQVFALSAKKESSEYLLYYALNFSAILGSIAYLLTIFISKKFYFKKLKIPDEKFGEMRLPRTYFLIVVLPVVGFSILSILEPLRPIVSTAVNYLITVPCAICGATLIIYLVNKIRNNKIKIPIGILFGLVFLLAIYNSIALFILSLIGLSDIIVNLRKLFDYALG